MNFECVYNAEVQTFFCNKIHQHKRKKLLLQARCSQAADEREEVEVIIITSEEEKKETRDNRCAFKLFFVLVILKIKQQPSQTQLKMYKNANVVYPKRALFNSLRLNPLHNLWK